MPPSDLRFGGGSADSALNPLIAIWLLIAIAMILVLPRAKIITPFLLAFFTIPIGQVVVLGGFHFTALRVLILAGLGRRLSFPSSGSAGKYPGGFNPIDQAVILWSTIAVITFFLQFPGTAAAVQGGGVLLDTLGGYLVVRSFIPDGEAVRRTIKVLAVICIILGITMINEQITHVNLFGLLGGISAGVTIRNGQVRSSGTLGCLYAGAFSGVLIPLFVWLWKEKNSRNIALLGILGATAMVITSNSSTSQLALGGSLVGLSFWRFRKKMQLVRRILVCTLVGLHLYMKAPVWALIARIDLTGSSSGYQRFMIIDMTVKHFSQWWLIGTPDYINWGWDSWDLCNQFVAVALTGGLIALIFYIMIFSRGFSALGKARKRVDGDRRHEFLIWCFGATLFATIVAHFGINYMAQLIMGFLPLVACISVVAFEARKSASRTAPSTVRTRFQSVPGNEVPVAAVQARASICY
jgi:hypothetical protein